MCNNPFLYNTSSKSYIVLEYSSQIVHSLHNTGQCILCFTNICLLTDIYDARNNRESLCKQLSVNRRGVELYSWMKCLFVFVKIANSAERKTLL